MKRKLIRQQRINLKKKITIISLQFFSILLITLIIYKNIAILLFFCIVFPFFIDLHNSISFMFSPNYY